MTRVVTRRSRKVMVTVEVPEITTKEVNKYKKSFLTIYVKYFTYNKVKLLKSTDIQIENSELRNSLDDLLDINNLIH